MKLEMQMTERDKKLLIFLAIFVIVVGIGYWGVRPIIQDIIEIDEQIKDEEALAEINELKVIELPMIEKDNKVFEAEIVDARKQFYKMMTPDEVDKMMTSIVLSYGLYSYDLSISLASTPAEESAYKYSSKYAEDQAKKDAYEAELAAEEDEDSDMDDYDQMLDSVNVDDYDFSDEATGIYKASVSMRLGGERADLQRLIDDYSDTDKALKIESYFFTTDTEMLYNETTGGYEMISSDSLNIEISFFMCEE